MAEAPHITTFTNSSRTRWLAGIQQGHPDKNGRAWFTETAPAMRVSPSTLLIGMGREWLEGLVAS